MKAFYLWTGGKVLALNTYYMDKYRHAFVYEPRAPEGHQWQVLFKSKLTKRTKKHIPKEFLMHLVLMGVPV